MSAARSESPAEIQVQIITADEQTVKGNIEDPKYYSSGRFFPVQINTEIGSNKADRILRVINKLGHGTYGTVWLVEDTKPPANAPSRWKAIKMHGRGTADNDLRVLKEFKRAGITPEKALTEYQVAIPYEQFPIKGGKDGKMTYTCSVLPLLGPGVDNKGILHLYDEGLCSQYTSDYASRVACRQIAEALQKLHRMGIAHGDFRPANILFHLPHLDKLSQDEIMQVYGQPKAVELKNPTAMKEPDHIVFPATCDAEALREILARKNLDMGLIGHPGLQAPRATVVDMGAAWHHSWDLVHKTLIPVSYKAPECIIHQYGCTSVESDIWALGCSMVKIYMGRTAFRDNTWNSVLRRSDTDVLADMEFFLGPIPVPYRNAWKQLHKGKNTVFPSNPAHVGFLRYKELRDWRKEHRRDGPWRPLQLEVMKSELPKEKADVFLDLLEGIFKWFPDQRMSLEEILGHPFLQVSGAGPEPVSRCYSRNRRVCGWLYRQPVS